MPGPSGADGHETTAGGNRLAAGTSVDHHTFSAPVSSCYFSLPFIDEDGRY